MKIKAINLLPKLSENELQSFLKLAIKDSFMPIRREALSIYLKEMSGIRIELARTYLFDKHSSVRELATSYLKKEKFNVETFLIETLQSQNLTVLQIRGVIWGLAYIRTEELESLISAYSNHLFPSVRKSSIQALSKLSKDISKPYLLKGLGDSSPSVAKESARLIYTLKLEVTVLEVLKVFESVDYEHTLKSCLSVSKTLNKWKRLIIILSICKDRIGENERIDSMLDNELNQWDMRFNRSSSPLLKNEKEEIRELYLITNPMFRVKRDLLEFTLTGCGVLP